MLTCVHHPPNTQMNMQTPMYTHEKRRKNEPRFRSRVRVCRDDSRP